MSYSEERQLVLGLHALSNDLLIQCTGQRNYCNGNRRISRTEPDGTVITLADSYAGQGQHDKAKGYAEQLLQVIAAKPMPDGQTPEGWAKHQGLFTAYGNYVLGKLQVIQAGDSKQAFRDARKLLLTTEDPLKEAGGQVWGSLAACPTRSCRRR